MTRYTVVARRSVWATALLLMTDAEYAQLRMRCLAEGRGIPEVIGAMCDAGGRSRDTEWREVR